MRCPRSRRKAWEAADSLIPETAARVADTKLAREHRDQQAQPVWIGVQVEDVCGVDQLVLGRHPVQDVAHPFHVHDRHHTPVNQLRLAV